VRTAHYDTFGAALILTLEQGLGAAFTAEARAAWIDLYALIARTMQEGAREPALTA
jgi:hemoglobin-like flavoprotein